MAAERESNSLERLFDGLADKMDYEYENFYNQTITLSRYSIYAKSEEICCKKLIKSILGEQNRFRREEEEKLTLRPNLMDEIYCMMAQEGTFGQESAILCVEKLLGYSATGAT